MWPVLQVGDPVPLPAKDGKGDEMRDIFAAS